MKLHDKHAALVSIGRYLGMFEDKSKSTPSLHSRASAPTTNWIIAFLFYR